MRAYINACIYADAAIEIPRESVGRSTLNPVVPGCGEMEEHEPKALDPPCALIVAVMVTACMWAVRGGKGLFFRVP